MLRFRAVPTPETQTVKQFQPNRSQSQIPPHCANHNSKVENGEGYTYFSPSNGLAEDLSENQSTLGCRNGSGNKNHLLLHPLPYQKNPKAFAPQIHLYKRGGTVA